MEIHISMFQFTLGLVNLAYSYTANRWELRIDIFSNRDHVQLLPSPKSMPHSSYNDFVKENCGFHVELSWTRGKLEPSILGNEPVALTTLLYRN